MGRTIGSRAGQEGGELIQPEKSDGKDNDADERSSCHS